MLKKLVKNIQFFCFAFLLLNSFIFPSNTVFTKNINDREIQSSTEFSNQKLAEISFKNPPKLDYISKNNMDVFTTSDQFEAYNISLGGTDRTLESVSKTPWIEVTPPSPPIILQVPTNELVLWGETNTSFIWEVDGESDSSWILLKNESIFDSGVLSDKIIEVSVDNWYDKEWYPGTYNLTLHVEDTYGNFSVATVFITVALTGDPYADEFVEIASIYFSNGFKAVGAPDGFSAEIYEDYSNGYITLDMGYSEEIINEEGNDFTIISTAGEYTCWTSNNLSEAFVIIGTGEGNSSFDLNAIGFDKARYVRIEYKSGVVIEIDAIVAISYAIQKTDTQSPDITGPEDFTIFSNRTHFTISWELYDLTPLNFTIIINEEIYDSGFWNGSDITLTYFWDEIDLYIVDLILYDLFGNHASDTVSVQVKNQDGIGGTNRPYLYFLFLLSLAAIPIFLLQRKRRI